MFAILSFLGQALFYGLLTLPRTIGSGALLLYFLTGALLSLFRWVLWATFLSNGLTYSEAVVICLADVLLLSLPLYWLLFKSRAGHGANLMDGIALGAFLGLGFGLNYFLQLPKLFGETSFVSWTLGSIDSEYPTIVPDTDHYVVWSGYAIWGALVGFGFALARALRVRLRTLFCWLAPALIILLVFLELLVFISVQTGLVGQFTIWRPISEWFYWLDSSGRQSRLFLVLFYFFSFGVGEYFFIARIRSLKQFRLKSEPAKPTFLSELVGRVLALRVGILAFTEVSSFFRSRRRLITVLMEQDAAKGQDRQPSQTVMLAEDQVAEKVKRTEAVLAGETLLVDDKSLSFGQTIHKFAGGLAITLVFTGLYIFFITSLGGVISASLGNNAIGYVYATVAVTALAYTVAYFREQIVSWLPSPVRAFVKRERLGEKGQ